MAKRILEFTTEELHKLEMMVGYHKQYLPDQTPEEMSMFIELQQRFYKAYINAEYEDFKVMHKE